MFVHIFSNLIISQFSAHFSVLDFELVISCWYFGLIFLRTISLESLLFLRNLITTLSQNWQSFRILYLTFKYRILTYNKMLRTILCLVLGSMLINKPRFFSLVWYLNLESKPWIIIAWLSRKTRCYIRGIPAGRSDHVWKMSHQCYCYQVIQL